MKQDPRRHARGCEPARYHRPHVIAPGAELPLYDAGHVLGSAIVVLDLDDGGEHPGSYGQAALDLLHVGDSPFDFEGLRYVTDAEDSKAVSEAPGPAVIIAGSGMSEGGRVLHHLRTTISHPKNTIIVVGFQAEHTLGRRIAERRKEVRIFGLMHDLDAEVVVLDGFSAHADQQGLIDFAEAVRARGPLRQVVLVHGEPAAEDALAAALDKRGFPQVAVPERGARIRL